ncbi:MAG: histidinol dehydrogenase [Alphaproteobacteria bacterium]|nr:histidinol dehydrogenase [Alphaproteobacteria bacterium]
MPRRLDAAQDEFAASFSDLLAERREAAVDVRSDVESIVADVRARGDAALVDLNEKFDRLTLTADELRVPAAEIAAARKDCDPAVLDALDAARARIMAYHEKQRPDGFDYVDDQGARLASRWRPVSAAGLYVPGGTAAYPSSVLMNALPARVAGVERLVMAVPAPDGALNPLVLAAAEIAGVDEVYRVGGAQAIAALAYGTATIEPVDKIVGPGNAYVAEAKRQVFGVVGIDMIAGPSEILVVAEASADPAWVAADLLSQAEHDTSAQSILITDDAAFADAVEAAVASQIPQLPRHEIAGESWERFGATIVVGDLDESVALIDWIAPEHLELMGPRAEALVERIRNAGSIFLGAYAPEVLGDYLAGPNHVLPTARTARFSSGLGVLDFMKRSAMFAADAESFRALASPAMILARAEGLEAHARAVEVRLDGDPSDDPAGN